MSSRADRHSCAGAEPGSPVRLLEKLPGNSPHPSLPGVGELPVPARFLVETTVALAAGHLRFRRFLSGDFYGKIKSTKTSA